MPAIHLCLPRLGTRPWGAWLRPWLGSPKYEPDRSADRPTALRGLGEFPKARVRLAPPHGQQKCTFPSLPSGLLESRDELTITLESRHQKCRLKICNLFPEALQNRGGESLGTSDPQKRVAVAVVKEAGKRGKDGRPLSHRSDRAGPAPVGGGDKKCVILLSGRSEHTNRLLPWARLPRGLFFSHLKRSARFCSFPAPPTL